MNLEDERRPELDEVAHDALRSIGRRMRPDALVVIETTVGYTANDKPMAEAIVAMWRDIGVNAKVDTLGGTVEQTQERVGRNEERIGAVDTKAEAAGIKVVMNRCPKIEYGRLSGEIGWNGVNSGVISSKKPTMRQGFQSFGIRQK